MSQWGLLLKEISTLYSEWILWIKKLSQQIKKGVPAVHAEGCHYKMKLKNLMCSSIVRNAVRSCSSKSMVWGNTTTPEKATEAPPYMIGWKKVLDIFNLWPGTCWISRSVENGCQCRLDEYFFTSVDSNCRSLPFHLESQSWASQYGKRFHRVQESWAGEHH